jgi:WD40 repeat protein
MNDEVQERPHRPTDAITTGNIEGVGIAIGAGSSVTIYGDIHYYPIKLAAPLRALFDPLIEDRVRLFAGREALFRWVIDGIQAQAGSYNVITAPAGFGKTAALAALMHRTPQAFAYHFFSPLYGNTLDEHFFLRNVVQQMASWHKRTEEVPSDLNELRALYQQFLNTPLERPQVLVLDGLDEVTNWSLAPYLSRHLPACLHLILTIRDVGQDWHAKYQLPPDQVRHLMLDGLNRTTVEAVFRAADGLHPDFSQAIADDPHLLDQIVRIAAYQTNPELGADPFYVRLLAEDAAAGKLTRAMLEGQPSGLKAYLDRWWQEIRSIAGSRPIRDLFGTLTAALGPLSRKDLENVNPSLEDEWSTDYFAEVLGQVQRFVITTDRGYALAHPRLQEYLLSKIRVDTYREQLIAYCSDWARHGSPYALSYYTQHLALSNASKQLVATVIDLRYIVAKAFLLNSFAVENDIKLALRLTPEDLTLRALHSAIAQSGHLFDACADQATLAATLYGRLCHLHELHRLAKQLETTIARPYLAPRHPWPDLPNPAHVRSIQAEGVYHWALSANAGILAFLTPKPPIQLRVWDLHAENEKYTRNLPESPNVQAFKLSADGQVALLAIGEKIVEVWDIVSGSLRYSLNTPGYACCDLSFDGTVVAVQATAQTVEIWDGVKGKSRHILSTPTSHVRTCHVTPDGRSAILLTESRELQVWDTREGTLRYTIAEVKTYRVGSNNKTIIVLPSDNDHILKLYELNTGSVYRKLESTSSAILHYATNVDCTIIATFSHDGRLSVYKEPSDQAYYVLQTKEKHWLEEDVELTINPTGRLIAFAYKDESPIFKRTINILDTEKGRVCYSLQDADYWHSTAVSGDGQLLIARFWESFEVWNVSELLTTTSFPDRPDWSNWVSDCAISADGSTITAVWGNCTFRVWDGITGEVLYTDVQNAGGLFHKCAISGDGSVIVTLFSGDLKIWDRSDMRAPRVQYDLGGIWGGGCAISADGHTVVTTYQEHTTHVYTYEHSELCLRFTLNEYIGIIDSCFSSTDGKIIVSVGRHGIYVFLQLDQHIAYKIHLEFVNDASLSANGKVLAIADGNTLRIWNVFENKEEHVFEVDVPEITSCTLNADGSLVCMTTESKDFRVYDTSQGICISKLQFGEKLVNCACSSDGTWQVAAGENGHVYFLQFTR